MKRKLALYGVALLFCAMFITVKADAQTQSTVVEISPLFNYPEAPEDLATIYDKSDWLVEHFWDQMNFDRSAVDQSALDHAFKVYTAAMVWADKNKVRKSISDLFKRVKKNPTLIYQLTKAAENNLYNYNADFLIDEAYVMVLETALKEKKFPKNKRSHYESQLAKVKNNLVGEPLPQFKFVDRSGNTVTYNADEVPALFMVAPKGSVECRMWKVQLDMNKIISALAADGRIKIYHLTIGEPDSAWIADVADYPTAWTVGALSELGNILDVRIAPSFIVTGNDGNLIIKNATLDQAVMTILDTVIVKDNNAGEPAETEAK